MKERILIAEDEMSIRHLLRAYLEKHGFQVEEAENCGRARQVFLATSPDLAILDYELPDGNALDLLPFLKSKQPHTPLIILTGHATIELAVHAMKKGADQFVTKPVDLDALLANVKRLLDSQRDHRKRLATESQQTRRSNPFFGTSPLIRRLEEQAGKLMSSESTILIEGETGVGKGVLARWLHDHSSRSEEAFVDLNCASLSRELLETELFGHERGAFTSASANKKGLMEVAHHGTLFLDEIADIDLQVQPKVLKVIEEKRFRRLGDTTERRVDVRLIAATCQDLDALVHEKRFRRDLFFRISSLPLRIPSLRERAEDISVLARQILRELAAELARGEMRLSAELENVFQKYSWPGNIRELRNVLEHAVLLSENPVIGVRDVQLGRWDGRAYLEEPRKTSLDAETCRLQLDEFVRENSHVTLAELERRYISRILSEEGSNVSRAAKRLGIPRSSLYQKLKKLDRVHSSLAKSTKAC